MIKDDGLSPEQKAGDRSSEAEFALPRLQVLHRSIPAEGRLTVAANPADYLVILREDYSGSLKHLWQSLGQLASAGEQVEAAVCEEGAFFMKRLMHSMSAGYEHHPDPQMGGQVRFEILSGDDIKTNIRNSTQNSWVISVDHLLGLDCPQFEISHLWTLDGRTRCTANPGQSKYDAGALSNGAVPRPGSLPLSDQLARMKRQYLAEGRGRELVLQDDIVFSGVTMKSVVDLFHQVGMAPQRIVLSIGIGSPEDLLALGVKVDPVVQYLAPKGEDIFKFVNMYGFADYLVGGAGLVVLLPSGKVGRAPYIQPFLAPEFQAQVDPRQTREFSIGILEANRAFYKELQSEFNVELLVEHLDPAFAALLLDVHGQTPNTPIDKILDWSVRDIDKIWRVTSSIADAQRTRINL